MSSTMYAQLGDVVFELTGPVVGMGAQHGYTYVEHAVIEGKPQLQSVGDALQRISIDLAFIDPLHDPVGGMRGLRAAAEAHRALPFVFAGGEVRGRYVIESIEETLQTTDGRGVAIHLEARLQLVEWIELPQPPAGAAGTSAAPRRPTATRSQHSGRARRPAQTTATRPPARSVPPSQVVRRDRPQFQL